MAVHRVITTTLGSIEERVSPARPAQRDLPPPITVLKANDADRSEPIVTRQPATEAEPMGSFKWRVGRYSLLINSEHVSTTPFGALFSAQKDLFERIGGGSAPVQGSFVDCMFFPHRNNWLSSLTPLEHIDLFRFLFSSTNSWSDDSVSGERVDLASTPDQALARFNARWLEADITSVIEAFEPESQERMGAASGTAAKPPPPIIEALNCAWNEPVIIVERSPPLLTSLKELLLSSNGVAIGGFVGAAAGIERPLFLLATVPLGIVVVAAAVGVGIAAQQVAQQIVRERLLLLLDGKTEVPSPNSTDRPTDHRSQEVRPPHGSAESAADQESAEGKISTGAQSRTRIRRKKLPK